MGAQGPKAALQAHERPMRESHESGCRSLDGLRRISGPAHAAHLARLCARRLRSFWLANSASQAARRAWLVSARRGQTVASERHHFIARPAAVRRPASQPHTAEVETAAAAVVCDLVAGSHQDALGREPALAGSPAALGATVRARAR